MKSDGTLLKSGFQYVSYVALDKLLNLPEPSDVK